MRRTVFAFVVIRLAVLSVAAQDMEPIGYIAELRVKPGQESKLIELVKKYDKPLFDRLQAEGAVLAWGLDTRVIHQEGAATHMLWWATADYSGMDKVFAGFAAMNVPDEDEKALQAAVDPDKHHDHITRSIIINLGEEEPSGTVYTSWSFFKVKPGKSSEWKKLFEKYNKPVYDQLVADGTIFGYGIDVEDFHTDDPGWRALWVVTTSLGALDKVDAAFDKAREAMAEEGRQAIGNMFRELTDPSEHRDSLWRSISLKDGGM